MLPYIRRYIDLGFVIHPCCPPDHRCQSPGKIPFDPYEGKHMAGWQNHSQCSVEWWEEMLDLESSINIGFLCGSPSGLVCLDIDNEEGMDLLGELNLPWRDTWQYRTGRGLRVLFRASGKQESSIFTRGDRSFEILGDGRQSVLPPSVHPNGSRYAWVAGSSPRDRECLELDNSQLNLGGTNAGEITSEGTQWSEVLKKPPTPGERNVSLASIAGHLFAPGRMAQDEVEFWLGLYNSHVLPHPVGSRELSAIIRSVDKMERKAVETGDREVKRLMAEYGISRADAETMWRGM